MQSEEVFDYVIVGAGMAGASVAYRLGLLGASVAVIEQEAQPGYHSTGRSAAMFMETYGTAHTRALTRASRDFYLNPPDGFSENPILTPRGALYIAHVGQEHMLDTAYNAYHAQQLEVYRLTASQAIDMVPCLSSHNLVGAIHDPVASDMDVHGLHQGFVRGMRNHGVTLLTNAQLQSATCEHGVWTLCTSRAEVVRARAIINAGGAWADTVAANCGVAQIGIQPMRRSAFLFPAPEGVDISRWPTVLGVDESYYFKPDAGALLGSSANADPVPPHDVVPEELDIATGIYRIEQTTTLRIRRPSHVWAGLRSFASDHEFVIGWDAKVQGFFWLAGQGGYGIQTAAAASELASVLVLNKAMSASLSEHGVNAEIVDPARFNLSTKQ